MAWRSRTGVPKTKSELDQPAFLYATPTFFFLPVHSCPLHALLIQVSPTASLTPAQEICCIVANFTHIYICTYTHIYIYIYESVYIHIYRLRYKKKYLNLSMHFCFGLKNYIYSGFMAQNHSLDPLPGQGFTGCTYCAACSMITRHSYQHIVRKMGEEGMVSPHH